MEREGHELTPHPRPVYGGNASLSICLLVLGVGVELRNLVILRDTIGSRPILEDHLWMGYKYLNVERDAFTSR